MPRQSKLPRDGSAVSASAAARVPHPAIRAERGRLLVSVHVAPRASRNALTLDGTRLRAHLTAPPVAGAANAALLALLAERLGLPRSAITLVRGSAARDKVVAVAGLEPEDLWQRLLL